MLKRLTIFFGITNVIGRVRSDMEKEKRCPLKFMNSGGDRYCVIDCAWFDGVGCGILDISVTGSIPKPVKVLDNAQLERLITSFTDGLRTILK